MVAQWLDVTTYLKVHTDALVKLIAFSAESLKAFLKTHAYETCAARMRKNDMHL